MTGDRPIISIRGVTKRFGPVVAVDGVSLEIRANEFFALLGPSGCGKTTLLRMLAGFETPDQGEILIDGQDTAGVPPNRRPVNMVFQSYAVFPHMTVFDNVAYGLRVVKTSAGEVEARVREALAMTRLAELAGRKPDQLSGGQRQRVALTRALVKRPKVLLLDEPLSALDAKLREAMRLELVRLQHTVGITFIIVTHDQNEALSMANRIAVMDGGRVRQVARPAELYEFPNCRFVADFIGKMNLFEGRVTARRDGQLEVEVPGLGRLLLPGEDAAAHGPANGGEEVGVAVRPEKVRIHRDPGPEGRIALRGKVSEIAYYGDTSHVYVALDSGPTISAHLRNEARSAAPTIAVGEELWCSWDPRDTLVLTS
ncbi:MAG: ABC transporter ATP-binding protein [Kiloniellaceae bacterium]